VKTVGEFIRDHINRGGPSYVRGLWKAYVEFCEEFGYDTPTYDSFRSTVYVLRDQSMLTLHHTEQVKKGIQSRRYYDIPAHVDDDDDRWRDLWSSVYG
jgi:hypothetical protein